MALRLAAGTCFRGVLALLQEQRSHPGCQGALTLHLGTPPGPQASVLPAGLGSVTPPRLRDRGGSAVSSVGCFNVFILLAS